MDSTRCILSAENLANVTDAEQKRLIMEMIDVLPAQELVNQKLCNQGFEYISSTLFRAVQFNNHKSIRSNVKVKGDVHKKATDLAVGLIGSTKKIGWAKAAADVKAMKRLIRRFWWIPQLIRPYF
jgi:hypothetical protein